MILEKDYLSAKKIIVEYEKQQLEIDNKYKTGDVLLADIMPKRALTCFKQHNEHYEPELIWLSDLVRCITNREHFLLKMRNMGKKTVSEVMDICYPPLL